MVLWMQLAHTRYFLWPSGLQSEWGEGVPDEGMQEGMCKYPDLLLGLWRPANIKMIMTASSFANFV